MTLLTLKKIYTMLEIAREHLLISPRNGKPLRSIHSVRKRLTQCGFKPEHSAAFNQPTYRVLGSDIKRMNEYAKQNK